MRDSPEERGLPYLGGGGGGLHDWGGGGGSACQDIPRYGKPTVSMHLTGMYSCDAKKSDRFRPIRCKGAFILDRKRRRFQLVTLFPVCVFILQRRWQQQRSNKKSLSRSLQYK